jgi:hypothetical protein
VAKILDYPRVLFLLTFFVLWFAAWLGGWVNQWKHGLEDDVRPDFGTVLAATLTLLGLIIGFSFSMATTRYDLRKTYEESEANAIGTEYIRADLLPAADGARVRDLLRQYTDLRIRFYTTRSEDDLAQIDTATTKVQNELWTATSKPAMGQPTPVIALTVAGMNDVINSQGYTQAAWWNRIPGGAWALMFVIALFCNVMLGYGARKVDARLLMVLPLVVAISFLLISDIDSPRRGFIKVVPQNLESLRAGLGQ